MAVRRANKENKKHAKTWTLICLLLVLAAAFLARGVVVYRFYPLDHQPIIAQNSEEYSLDPYLVSALICAESRFKADAVSPKGAVGLMQIMPDTGEWVAGKIGMEGYSRDVLSDPVVNIKLGCWYLNYLNERFSGDIDKVLAGYNAGPSKVTEWAGDGQLTDIPYPETEKYLRIVKRNHYIYKGLYNDF